MYIEKALEVRALRIASFGMVPKEPVDHVEPGALVAGKCHGNACVTSAKTRLQGSWVITVRLLWPTLRITVLG
jgi:hypothetical protein